MELIHKTANELGRMIRSKEIGVVELTNEYLSGIDKKDKDINSYITVTRKFALKQAEEVQALFDSDQEMPPLAGIPMNIEDSICTKGILTTGASKMLYNFVPPYDAAVVEKLIGNNYVLLGKTNLDEFGIGNSTETSFFGRTANPYDKDRTPGGSSGGPAAAVAAGLSCYGLGSDTGGSVRVPAGFCGVVGFKPTYGAVSRFGGISISSSFGQTGSVTKDVTDAALVMNAIAGYDNRDTVSYNGKYPDYTKALVNDVKGLKVALPEEFFNAAGLRSEVRDKVMEAVRVLEKQGAVFEKVSLDVNDYVLAAYYVIGNAEAASNMSKFDGIRYGYRADDCENLDELYTKTRTEGFGSRVKQNIISGTLAVCSEYYDTYYKRALKARTKVLSKYNEIFTDFDVVIGPVSPDTAFKFGNCSDNNELTRLRDIYASPANLAGLPAISLPCGFDKKGLPIGMQIMAKPFNDAVVLRCAYTYEQAINN